MGWWLGLLQGALGAPRGGRGSPSVGVVTVGAPSGPVHRGCICSSLTAGIIWRPGLGDRSWDGPGDLAGPQPPLVNEWEREQAPAGRALKNLAAQGEAWSPARPRWPPSNRNKKEPLPTR